MEFEEFEKTHLGKLVCVPTKRGRNVGTIVGTAQSRATWYCYVDFGEGNWQGLELTALSFFDRDLGRSLIGKQIYIKDQGPWIVRAVCEEKNPGIECENGEYIRFAPLRDITRIEMRS